MTNKKSPIKHFLEVTLQGVFWLLPIVAVVMIVLWLYNKVDLLAHGVFTLIGFAPQNNGFLWLLIVVVIFVFLLYIVGHLMETRVANFLETLISKIPGYSTIKDIIGIFNSSKKGETQVLVVAIRGFANEGYNIGLMYSQKESIIKEHYTVTLSQTPIPNGGYMFEVHKDNIFVIEEAKFDDNLKYLLSMGVKSMSDIVKVQPKRISDFISLSDWLGRKNGIRD
ncbi:DUF502 domain-containing protein [Candidatus Sulfurimonas marisnigri]|uniref:DUF502 domain-containing protein n=1 Tax=Candidatus Sulfurimonas marisnigri TaxID=2740405 RepID=A0A7S7M1W5_9BACT|nr:DUF502 domain-containing protein [Candidatus Sulfurimonas marisnigri]QOY55611.1 DUF502 domain-containing protein [Candidatus Sulfurimonas marisnigri]